VLSANVTPLVAEAKDRELAAVAERFLALPVPQAFRYIFFRRPMA